MHIKLKAKIYFAAWPVKLVANFWLEGKQKPGVIISENGNKILVSGHHPFLSGGNQWEMGRLHREPAPLTTILRPVIMNSNLLRSMLHIVWVDASLAVDILTLVCLSQFNFKTAVA